MFLKHIEMVNLLIILEYYISINLNLKKRSVSKNNVQHVGMIILNYPIGVTIIVAACF